jgi:hypothetical protein
MARRVFFSFHHDPTNVWKVQQIKQMNTLLDTNQFLSNDWEEVKKKGDAAVKAWINNQLDGCGVTLVFITQHAHSRPFIRYEIERSISEKKGLFGIYIHDLKDKEGDTHIQGVNPLPNGFKVYNPSNYINGLGGLDTPYKVIKNYIGTWIEEAAKQVGR